MEQETVSLKQKNTTFSFTFPNEAKGPPSLICHPDSDLRGAVEKDHRFDLSLQDQCPACHGPLTRRIYFKKTTFSVS